MRLLPPGSFAWLVLHELRVGSRMRAGKLYARIIGWALLLAWLAAGTWIAWGLRDVPFDVPARIFPLVGTITLTVCLAMFSFMATQSILASQRTLYDAGDLDLLFSAPIAPRNIVSAKLIGIVVLVTYTYSVLLLPVAIPVAILGHPQVFGVPLMLLGLSLASSCVGLMVTLLVARIAGPRAARTMGQIVAALAGGAVFLATQIMNQGEHGRSSGWAVLFERLRGNGFGTHGVGALPGRALLGDPIAIAALFGGGVLLFALTSWGMQTLFVESYRAGGMRLSSRRGPAKGKISRNFRASLTGTIFAKEWRLLARDPALTFRILLRLIYLVPFLLILMRTGREVPLAPSLAFTSVLIAGQLVGSLAWLTVSAEDSPDLLRVAPVDKETVDSAKLGAALAMAAPVALLLPLGMAIVLREPLAALVTLVFTVIGGSVTGYLEVSFAKPAPRSSFQRRQSGSILGSLFEFLIMGILGLVAAVLVYLLEYFVG